jgi:hypothetical protein
VSVRFAGLTVALAFAMGGASARAADPKPGDAPAAAAAEGSKPAKAKKAGQEKQGKTEKSDAGGGRRQEAAAGRAPRCGPRGARGRRRRRRGGRRGLAGRVGGRKCRPEPLAEMLRRARRLRAPRPRSDALAKLGGAGRAHAPRAFEVLDLYAGHRAPEIRQRAVKGAGDGQGLRA